MDQAAKDVWRRIQRHQNDFDADIKCDIDNWEWHSIRSSNDNDQIESVLTSMNLKSSHALFFRHLSPDSDKFP